MNMPFSRPVLEPNARIDFYAGNSKAFDNLLPVYKALPEDRKGVFYAWEKQSSIQVSMIDNYLPGYNPLVISSLSDLNHVFYAGEERPFIFMEFDSVRQTRGLLVTVSLILCSQEADAVKRKFYAQKYQQIETFTDSKQAANKIIHFVKGVSPKYRYKCNKETIGLIYMAFGDKAVAAVKRSIATLKRIGYSYPICIVGDTLPEGFTELKVGYDPIKQSNCFIPWEGQSPFDPNQRKNFQFRAGRVKPFLYQITPFERTMYLDADTEFVEDIFKGFELLDNHDIILTEEYLKVSELYNKFQAGWEINIAERDQTIKEGISPDAAFVNSGVMLFKQCKVNDTLFTLWYKEWKRFQEWDEQLALMRALHQSKARKYYLPPVWNDPHVKEDTIIFHNYGRAGIRMNVS